MPSRNVNNTVPFHDISALVRLVDRFESGRLPAREWNHRSHLAVTAWYMINFGESDAADRMIVGLRRYCRLQGIRMTNCSQYHETLTLFWLAVARRFLDNYPSYRVLTRVNGFVRKFGNRDRLHLEYYTPKLVNSWSARNSWVAPDLKPFPGTAPQRTDTSGPRGRPNPRANGKAS